jgi:glucose-1-phosphate adenylyltransferase
MGIYIFEVDLLRRVLARDAKDKNSNHDFGMNIIPSLVGKCKAVAHRFSQSCVRREGETPYWRDVGTVDAYWAANMDMIAYNPKLNVNDNIWPIWKGKNRLPPLKFGAGKSVIAEGCCIANSNISNSLLCEDVMVNASGNITESILLPRVIVGKNVILKKAIVDHECVLPDNLVVGENPEEDARRFYRTGNGIVLINSEMLRNLV